VSKKKTSNNNAISINWIRFAKDPSANLNSAFKTPKAYAIVGGIRSGKSSLLELLGSKYTKIIDLYGSRDNEGLAWLRSPFKDSVLFLKGQSAKVDCNCADVMNTVDFKIKDAERYKVIISVSSFYSKIEEEWYSISKFFDKLWHRTHWKEPWCVLIREASNLLYSRLSLGETQQMAKSYMIYVIREMRHCGFAIALDTIRWHSIDIDLRTLADYTFIKAQGIEGLPSSLRFVYIYFSPYGVMRMPVNKFIILSRHGPIGFGKSIMPPWHKQEKEDLLQEFDIMPSYNELAFSGEKGFGRVSDYEHLRIIKARVESDKGMEKLAIELGRSSKTIFTHINIHNNMIHAVGECDRCLRVNSPYTKTIVH
jgi:hypothetical protein